MQSTVRTEQVLAVVLDKLRASNRSVQERLKEMVAMLERKMNRMLQRGKDSRPKSKSD
jgi:hypothetical protein